MNDSNTVTDQEIRETSSGGGTYVAIDGILKYCINAPLLELPIDFKEWYKPPRGDEAVLMV
jgi:hypothetical protein